MEDGTVGNIVEHGGKKALQDEAERIISMLPKMTPGMQGGRPVKVSHAIPVAFKLNRSLQHYDFVAKRPGQSLRSFYTTKP